MSRLAFVWLVRIGAVIAVRERAHIGLGSVLPVTGVPTAAFALAGLLAAVAMAALYAVQTSRALTGRPPDSELVQIRQTAEDLPGIEGPAPDSKEPRP